MIIQNAETDEQIAATYDVMHPLRPHLERDGYVPLIRGLMASGGFRLAAAIDDEEVRAVAGYRFCFREGFGIERFHFRTRP